MALELQNIAPAENSIDARRDWSITVDVVDTTNGVDTGVVLKINGTSVTVTETAITDGRRIEYTPGTASGYGERITAEITATPTGQSAESISWRFTVVLGAEAATSSPPPLVVVAKDISLTTAEADETHGGVNVVWLPAVTHPLIVTEDQAQAVGTVRVYDAVYHKHRRTLLVDNTDANDDTTAELQEGDIITFTCSALGETVKKAQVLASKQQITQRDGVQYQVLVEYYELVS